MLNSFSFGTRSATRGLVYFSPIAPSVIIISACEILEKLGLTASDRPGVPILRKFANAAPDVKVQALFSRPRILICHAAGLQCPHVADQVQRQLVIVTYEQHRRLLAAGKRF